MQNVEQRRCSVQAKESFSNWAKTLVGCDGGDIARSDTWVCGIEWGYAKEKGQSADDYDQMLRKYYSEGLVAEMGRTAGHTHDTYDISAEASYRFGEKLAKLHAVIEGNHASQYREVAAKSSGTEIFKLNLYPIAFPETADYYWQKYELEYATGIQTKELYRVWCCLNRFPIFAGLVETHQPRLIVGTGVGYLTQFALAFGGRDIEGFERVCLEPASEKNGKAREMYVGMIRNSTLLVVTPFFGHPSGLNSDHLIQQVGNEIRERLPNKKTV